MSLFVENLVTHGYLRIDEETRRLLLQISPATIGRLLVGERRRYLLHKISHTRSTPLGGRIPIQTCMDPLLDIPGVLSPPVPRGSRPGATSPRYTTQHGHRAHRCRHGRMFPKRRRNASLSPVQSWT